MDGGGSHTDWRAAFYLLEGSEGGFELRECFWMSPLLEDVSRCYLMRCLDALGLVGFHYSIRRASEP